jgi:hypothetical protein
MLRRMALPVSVHVGRLHHGAAGIGSVAGHHVEHARRQVGNFLLHQAAELQQRQRRLLGRLEHHRAAGGEGGTEFPGGQHQRIIPRHDQPAHADRFLEREIQRVVGDAQGFTVHLVGQAAVVLEAGGGVSHVELAFDNWFAAVERLQFRQAGRVFADQCGHLQQDAAANLGLGRIAPVCVVECRAGGVHGPVDVGCRRLGHDGNVFAGGGIDHVAGGIGSDPFMVDKHLPRFHRGPPGG